MARIAGVDLPQNKQVWIGLTYIYGIGRSRSQDICAKSQVPEVTKVRDLTEDEARRIRKVITDEGRVEGDLRKEISQNIKRLMEIGCYRGVRHRRGLPARGERAPTKPPTPQGARRGARAGKKKADQKKKQGKGRGRA